MTVPDLMAIHPPFVMIFSMLPNCPSSWLHSRGQSIYLSSYYVGHGCFFQNKFLTIFPKVVNISVDKKTKSVCVHITW